MPRETLRLFHLVDARGLFGEREERNLWPEPLRPGESMSQDEKPQKSYWERESRRRGASARLQQWYAGTWHPSSRPWDREALRRPATLTSRGPAPGFAPAFNISTRRLVRCRLRDGMRPKSWAETKPSFLTHPILARQEASRHSSQVLLELKCGRRDRQNKRDQSHSQGGRALRLMDPLIYEFPEVSS